MNFTSSKERTHYNSSGDHDVVELKKALATGSSGKERLAMSAAGSFLLKMCKYRTRFNHVFIVSCS
jgi:hypothetical protein